MPKNGIRDWKIFYIDSVSQVIQWVVGSGKFTNTTYTYDSNVIFLKELFCWSSAFVVITLGLSESLIICSVTGALKIDNNGWCARQKAKVCQIWTVSCLGLIYEPFKAFVSFSNTRLLIPDSITNLTF